MTLQRALLFLSWTLVRVDFCLSQSNCTGVDCPVLHNCIETVLEAGVCCPACLHKGCTCEGYQYYDCVQAGFRQGKVPEQESYFVDFGSTECSCPQGGGRITCRFILCPEIPPNCIDVLQPADGCQQCGRIGCTHGSRKYEAGHSFQVDRCQVCHCPLRGGTLMCSPVPGCDSNAAETPLDATTGNQQSSRRHRPAELLSRLTLENTLPLYKQDPPSLGTEDYDYSPAEPTSSTVQNLAQPLESTTVPLVHPHSSLTYGSRHEKVPQNPDPIPAGAQTRTATETTESHTPQEELLHTMGAVPDTVHGSREGGQRAGGPKQEQTSIQFRPTSASPVRMSEHEDRHHRQPHTLHSSNTEEEEAQVSAKELVRTCCETGEKWASANGHCDNMDPPIKDRHSICWTAQQQCCRSSLRRSQCLAGINAARTASVCEDGDKCGIDSYKECCYCCSLGLQFRSEGHRCDAHHYLGFQCRHVFLTCCQGDEWTESQDGWHGVRERPALRPTAPPTRVTDSPFPKEAFSIGEEQDNAVEVEDMDECLIYEGNICHHRCVNTPGSYRCECFPGYQLQDDAFTCAETVSTENRLEDEATSPLTPPPQPLAPFNPCEGNNPCEQLCSPVGGRPQCSCSTGFSLGPDALSCEDINECLSSGACQPSERCVNTAGSYVCQAVISCPSGFHVHSNACEDINECLQSSHNCGPGFDCVNTEGSFRCSPKPRCPAGFGRDAQGKCTDTDECGTLAQPCSPGFNCINTPGSYMCQRRIMCSRGFHASPNGSSCVDVDECQSGLHRCGDGQLCRNLPGSYRCECQTGHQYDSFRRTCVDVNECVSNPCSQECANVYGSYQCYCRQGFYLREDGHSCEDIDECSQSVGHLCTYKCVNVLGSYRCACPESGYSVSPNGRSCRDIDECDTGTHNCSLAQTCYNVQGSFRCLALHCPPNYRKVSNTRCERISCPSYLECQNSPLRITYYYLSFQSNIVVPAQIFRMGPSPAYSGDDVIVSITQGNEQSYFSIRKLNAYTGALYLQRQVDGPRDFLVHVEMKLWRQGTFTTFHARIYVFITAHAP
ncbi:fibulin-2-like isoform X2 [Betta splendens]|uniref:Fibulin-2-like isoform X2 n=1 Tax=Betta splendens TaxID=158456 RepID=A0A9W2XXB2_BETSP|nr:fibulin-2-like isoform X2 [Betta splendens]